jgi:hypothetical protein
MYKFIFSRIGYPRDIVTKNEILAVVHALNKFIHHVREVVLDLRNKQIS